MADAEEKFANCKENLFSCFPVSTEMSIVIKSYQKSDEWRLTVSLIFKSSRADYSLHLPLLQGFSDSPLKSRLIMLLLTEFAQDRIGRISALGLVRTSPKRLGPYCQDSEPISPSTALALDQ